METASRRVFFSFLFFSYIIQLSPQPLSVEVIEYNGKWFTKVSSLLPQVVEYRRWIERSIEVLRAIDCAHLTTVGSEGPTPWKSEFFLYKGALCD